MRRFYGIICLLALLPLAACKESRDYPISLSKSLVETGPEMFTCSVEVETDGAWTAEARGANGFRINWITLSPSSGNGRATLTVTVKENSTFEARTAVVAVTSESGNKASLRIKQDVEFIDTEERIKARIGSFNLRISPNSDYDTGDGWDLRKARVVSAIKSNDFDVFGIQEVSGPGNGGIIKDAMQKDLVAELGDVYEFRFFSPYSQSGNGGSANGLAFKKDKFTMSGYKYFWLSENPDVMVKNDGTHSRGGTCAVFTHKTTGVQFFFMATHAPLDKEVNVKLAYLYPELEKKYNTGLLPSFLVGDMNNYQGSDASITYRTWWNDAYMVLSEQGKTIGPSGTFNGFNVSADMNTRGRIDYIYYRGAATPLEYKCDDTLYDGHYPSDHLPIYCDFIISASQN